MSRTQPEASAFIEDRQSNATRARLSASIAARVTGDIRDALARGVKPWAQPFSSLPPPLPRRSSGQAYRGGNIPVLWTAATASAFLSPYWLTYKQAVSLGARVRRGERGCFIVFYAPRDEDTGNKEDDTKSARRAVLRSYTVFNTDQIDGLPEALAPKRAPIPSAPEHEDLAASFARVSVRIVTAGRAFYRPATDTVHIPPISAFRSPMHYYSTLAHELAHWTGHPNRLNRAFPSKRYGDVGYALEELTAELAAAFVGATLCLPVDHIEDHSSYIRSWLKVLSDDPSAFLTAAGKAQVAADYLLAMMQRNG